MKQLLIFVCILTLSQTVYSQSNDCAETIKALLPNGVYEYEKQSIDEELFKSVVSWYKENSDDTYSESRQRSAKATVPIGEVLVGFGLKDDEESYNRFIRNIETYNNDYLEHRQKIKREWTRINTDAIKELNNCFGAAPGIRAVKILTGDPNRIIVRFFYNNDYSINGESGPKAAKIRIVDKSPNIKVSEEVVRRLKIENKDHRDIFVTKTGKEGGNIIFEAPGCRIAPNSELTFEIGTSISKPLAQKPVEIENGTIIENPENHSSYISIPAMSEYDFKVHHSPISLPITNSLGPEYSTAQYGLVSWAKTLAEVNKSTSNNQYNWGVKIVNRCGGRCGPSAGTADAFLTPVYNTTIKLPELDSDKASWILTVNAESNASDAGTGVGSDAIIYIGGEEKLRFKIGGEKSSPIVLDNIKPGNYPIEMKMPKIGRTCGGGLPNGGIAETIFTTSLNVAVKRNEVKPNENDPIPNPQSNKVKNK